MKNELHNLFFGHLTGDSSKSISSGMVTLEVSAKKQQHVSTYKSTKVCVFMPRQITCRADNCKLRSLDIICFSLFVVVISNPSFLSGKSLIQHSCLISGYLNAMKKITLQDKVVQSCL